MPSGDRTGPMGQGPRTGRRIGIDRGAGLGRRAGIGRGACIGQGYSADRLFNFGLLVSDLIQLIPWQEILRKRDEIEDLKTEAKRLKRSNEELEEKLRNLENRNE